MASNLRSMLAYRCSVSLSDFDANAIGLPFWMSAAAREEASTWITLFVCIEERECRFLTDKILDLVEGLLVGG